MFINCFYDYRQNMMHLWEEIKGERFYSKEKWVPYVFTPASLGRIYTIDGTPVKKRAFGAYHEYYSFCKNNQENIFENNVKPDIQFLAERYQEIPDDDIETPSLLTYSLDIEVAGGEGFPHAENADQPVVLISLLNSKNKTVTTFGEKQYDDDNTSDSVVNYRHCETEKDLLERFFDFMHNHPADIITGWNVYGFDITYLINRTKRLFGQDTTLYNKLSPVNIVNTWKGKGFNSLNIDIAGVHILDYMDLYKWYSPTKLERYKLDFVTNFELEHGKLDYSEYEDLNELYEKDWKKYVDYNIRDVKLVDELEDKLGYIKLVQQLSLFTKCPMKYYQAMTHLIEGVFIVYYRRNNLCAPYFSDGTQESFEAAHVKEPQKGMKHWVIDIDITSSYPSAIITLNMSNETYFGRIQNLQESRIAKGVSERNLPPFHLLKANGSIIDFDNSKLEKFNKALEKGLFAVAPIGSVFSTSKKGVFSTVERQVFFKRVAVKSEMKKLRKMASKMPESMEKEKINDRAQEKFAFQWALKIVLNAAFGITSVPYSRYANLNIAEAITSCGRHTIKQGEKFVNELFNNPNNELKEIFEALGIPDHSGEETDLVNYIDTDSLFISIETLMIENNLYDIWKPLEDEVKIFWVKKIAKVIENYVNKRVYEETQLGDYNSQVTDFKTKFKQEIIAKTALFVKKKKYAYWCVDKEGIPEDKLSVTGLEIVRSDSAEAIRGRLKHVYEMIMKNVDENELLKTIQQYKKELKTVSIEEIANNIGVNNIGKYIGKGVIEPSTPYHVKGVFYYRRILKQLGLVNQYEDIYEGAKAKVVYVKPNPFQADVITFNRWPSEFNQFMTVDYDTMIDKFFLKKIGFLLYPMGKENLLMVNGATQKTLDAFFGG